ncbi:DUF3048 domain-containing protein [Metabacillus halosaccharovorans]|uniref:DUF3048 domain-containing protein n=1 Tax=Metabacillus halosaccharovorans TaxID=930124 RepID=UPI00203E09D4|nr:DUF3048 domain-containing protein [Metabacillus halosaccharovorans]MCM3444523.1 DUF3048 domain-containing protein [Metabacillus halosaccharovorans]
MRNVKFAAAFFSICVFMSACSNDESQEQSIPDNGEASEQIEETVVEAVEESVVSPLTGLETDEQNITQRPVSVMINNHPAARPQSGLTKADIVYEVLAEGNITRFLAVFQSDIPDIIGPVRSARPYYIDLSKGYDSLYIAHGYSPDALVKLTNGEVDSLNGMEYDGTLFWRADHRKAPHNSYISKENILEGAISKQYEVAAEVEPFEFLSEEEVQNLEGEHVNKFVIKYDNSQTWQATYEYNQTDKVYSRYSDTQQTVDLESNDPVKLSNIFVVEMDHNIVDDYGRRGIDLKSGGKALLLQNGLMKEVEWVNEDGRILPVKDGNIVKFVPGKTWINIVPNLDMFLIQSQE